MISCELCQHVGGIILHQDQLLRVVLVDDADYPGFCRIILSRHIKEMSDLEPSERLQVFDWLIRVEQALRTVMQPDKINLASLGNMVPHVHWHVIPRFSDDAHFPSPIWAAPRRKSSRRAPPDLAERLQTALMQNQ
jgi:diadenosine tetraphosphate (Ap4A) HIT family hydrolase